LVLVECCLRQLQQQQSREAKVSAALQACVDTALRTAVTLASSSPSSTSSSSSSEELSSPQALLPVITSLLTLLPNALLRLATHWFAHGSTGAGASTRTARNLTTLLATTSVRALVNQRTDVRAALQQLATRLKDDSTVAHDVCTAMLTQRTLVFGDV
jgi:hypothetical protein